MFLYGKLQRTSRSGTEVKCTGLYEYPGEVLEFVDQVAQFKKVKDGEYSSVNELPLQYKYRGREFRNTFVQTTGSRQYRQNHCF